MLEKERDWLQLNPAPILALCERPVLFATLRVLSRDLQVRSSAIAISSTGPYSCPGLSAWVVAGGSIGR